jgi:hypothetical protein
MNERSIKVDPVTAVNAYADLRVPVAWCRLGRGDPLTRERQAIADDVRAGYVSAEAARRDHGFEET